MKITLNDSKKALSDEEKKFFFEVFNTWTSNTYAILSEWDSSIDEFCEQEEVLIVFADSIPKDCNANELHLFMSEQDNASKAKCFFRHFRNALDHDHIYRSILDDEIVAKDLIITKKKKDEFGNQEEILDYKMCCRCSFEFIKKLTFKLLASGENAYNQLTENRSIISDK